MVQIGFEIESILDSDNLCNLIEDYGCEACKGIISMAKVYGGLKKSGH